MVDSKPSTVDRLTPGSLESWIPCALAGLEFGQVVITVQGGVVVQVERIERRRVVRKRY